MEWEDVYFGVAYFHSTHFPTNFLRYPHVDGGHLDSWDHQYHLRLQNMPHQLPFFDMITEAANHEN